MKKIILLLSLTLSLVLTGCALQNNNPQQKVDQTNKVNDFNYDGSCIPDQVQCFTCKPMHDKCFDEISINKSCDKCCSKKYYSDYLNHKPCECPKGVECSCASAYYCGEKVE